MAKKREQKVYMPLVIGDWVKGTRGMRAELKGVYIGLLLHQWDNGFIPNDVDELALIEPEVNKVWTKLKEKFIEVAPGKLQNEKCEEVREFWKKQKSNGKKGGRPKKETQRTTQTVTQQQTQNETINNDLDSDNDSSGFKYNYVSEDFSKPDVPGDEIIFPIDTKPIRDLWANWKKSRWENHELKYGMMGEQADLKRLQGMNYQQIEQTILAAIAGQWRNLYPERANGNGKSSNNSKQQQSSNKADYLTNYYAQKSGNGTAK